MYNLPIVIVYSFLQVEDIRVGQLSFSDLVLPEPLQVNILRARYIDRPVSDLTHWLGGDVITINRLIDYISLRPLVNNQLLLVVLASS